MILIHPGNGSSFLIHTIDVLLKHAADKKQVFRHHSKYNKLWCK